MRICKICNIEKKLEDFPFISKKRNNYRRNTCKLCCQEKYKLVRKKNDVNYRFKKYGFNFEDYQNLLEEQNHECAICGKDYNSEQYRTFNIDHDHQTGKVRGLLCNNCNTGLGLFKDNVSFLNKAVEYLTVSTQ